MKFLYRLIDDQLWVWRSDWTGDQHEVLTTAEFNSLTEMCKRFGISLDEAEYVK